MCACGWVGGWVKGHPKIARKAELAMPSALNPAPAAAVFICGPPPQGPPILRLPLTVFPHLRNDLCPCRDTKLF